MTDSAPRLRRLAVIAAIGLFASSGTAIGATAQSTFTVTGNVIAMCTISTTGITFTYDVLAATAATATGTVTIACTKGSAPSIGLDAGLSAASAPAGSTRAMKMVVGGITSYLGYDIRWPGTTTSWSTAAPYVPGASTSKAAHQVNMDGFAAAGQDVPVGTYTDTVTATVNF